MVFPKQTLTVRDPGLGLTVNSTNVPIFTGIAHGGSTAVNVLTSINDINQVRTLIGYGPLAEDVALALQERGGPIYFIIHNSVSVVTLTAAATVQSGAGPALTVSGDPHDRYSLKVKIVLGGSRGTATYQYSLDNFDSVYATPTWSAVRISPTGGTFVIPGTGLTLNFPVGTYVADETYTLDTVGQEPGTVDLALAAAILIADTSLNFFLWILSGAQSVAATGSGVAAALSGHLTTLTSSFRYARGICDVGSGTTAALTKAEAANWTSARIVPCYGFTLRLSALPYEGYSYRKTSCVSGIGVRATKELMSTDLARFASGADEGVKKIHFDGFSDNTLDDNKLSTMRTWPGVAGYYIAGAKLHSAFGSDFTDLQFGRVMDVACRTTWEAQLPYEAESLRTIGAADADPPSRPVGAIDERDAKTIEATVGDALSNALMVPKNVRGVPGHVSAVSYSVDLSVNLVTTSQLKTRVTLRPLGYSKDISTDLAFSLN